MHCIAIALYNTMAISIFGELLLNYPIRDITCMCPNPLHADFYFGDKNIYVFFKSVVDADVTGVVLAKKGTCLSFSVNGKFTGGLVTRVIALELNRESGMIYSNKCTIYANHNVRHSVFYCTYLCGLLVNQSRIRLWMVSSFPLRFRAAIIKTNRKVR